MNSENAIHHDTVNDTVATFSRDHSFDTFIHYQKLAEFQNESGIAIEDWPTLLKEWDYSPVDFIKTTGRGNCVDFAFGAQAALNSCGVDSLVIGKKPDDKFTPEQQRAMHYRHTSLVSSVNGTLNLFEPGWKLEQGIPLTPIKTEVDTGTWKFLTIELGNGVLTQQTTSPLGNVGLRTFTLDALPETKGIATTKGLLRVPRRMEMLTQLSDDVPHGIISYNPGTQEMKSTLEIMNQDSFLPEDIPKMVNNKISEYYGFDVKEELLGCFALYRALPTSFWIK